MILFTLSKKTVVFQVKLFFLVWTMDTQEKKIKVTWRQRYEYPWRWSLKKMLQNIVDLLKKV